MPTNGIFARLENLNEKIKTTRPIFSNVGALQYKRDPSVRVVTSFPVILQP